MLKANSKMFHNLCEEGIKDDKKDVFVDAFTEFIAELDDTDLSNKTKQHLYSKNFAYALQWSKKERFYG